MNYDASSLDSLYRGRLVELRELAESRGISKGGSVDIEGATNSESSFA